MDVIEERWNLAVLRIGELENEDFGDFQAYIRSVRELFLNILNVYKAEPADYKKWNESLYADIKGEAYETSYANPAFCFQAFGEGTGPCLSVYYVQFRGAIPAAYEKDRYEILKRMELFLQLVSVLSLEEEKARFLKENLY